MMRIPVKALAEKYRGDVFRAAFSVSRNPDDAEDVVQETFLQYMQSDRQFENEEHIKAWLMRIAINKSKNMRRLFWNQNRTSYEDYMGRLSFQEPEDRDLVEAVLALPQKYRIVIYLYYYEDYSIAEIAETAGIAQYSIQDSSGNILQQGGGVAENEDGTERPLTASEIQEDLAGPTTDTVDGRRYLYYKDQKMDITDKFDDDGLCYVTLQDGSKKIYVTITKNGGMSASEDRYTQKDELPEQWFEDD